MKYFISASTKEFPGKLAVTTVSVQTELVDIKDQDQLERKWKIFDLDSPNGREVAAFVLANLHRLPISFIRKHWRRN